MKIVSVVPALTSSCNILFDGHYHFDDNSFWAIAWSCFMNSPIPGSVVLLIFGVAKQ